MNVVSFRPRDQLPQQWQTSEMNSLLGACADSLDKGTATSWDVGYTESGDPQLYLLGPAPAYDCILCVSRVGRLYVLEDGAGRVVIEDDRMAPLADTVRSTLRRTRAAFVARITVAWVAIRETIEDRVEPMMAEPMEVLTHFAPQLAALA